MPEQVILAMIDTAKPKSLRKIVGVPAPPDAPAPPAEPETPPPDDVTTSTADAPPAPVVVNVSQHVSQQVDASPAMVEVPVPIAVPVIEHGRHPLPQPQQTPSQQYLGLRRPEAPRQLGPDAGSVEARVFGPESRSNQEGRQLRERRRKLGDREPRNQRLATLTKRRAADARESRP